MFETICSAIAYIHEQDIAHRDIGMENILLVSEKTSEQISNKTSRFIPKVCDFGLAIQGENLKCYKTVGKKRYWSPECENQDYEGKANDVWCLGVTLFLMLIGGHPYDSIGDLKYKYILERGTIEFVKRWSKDHLVTRDAGDVLQQILVPENNRISCGKILKMNWCDARRHEVIRVPEI